MSRRFFARNLLFVIGINLLVKPVWIFFIDRTVQIRVGHAAFGTYQALLNLAVIFQIMLDFGLNSYNSRTISQEPEKIYSQFPVLLSARLILISIYGSVVLLIGFLMGYRDRELWLLGGTLLLQSLTILLLFIRSNVGALQRFRLDGVLSVTDRFLMIAVCGFLLLYPATAHRFSIEWFVLAQIGCYAAAIIIGMVVLRRITSLGLSLSFDGKAVLAIIRQSAPYALLTFLMAIYMRSDTILIERISSDGKAEAGIYQTAARLLEVGNMISIMFASILLPLFGRMLAGSQDVSAIVRLCVNLLLPVSLLATVAAWTMGGDIMHLLYHSAGHYDGMVLAFLMTAFPAYSMTYVYSTLLTANGHIALLNKLAAIGVVVNLVMNFFLIPREHALGAAITACVTQWMLSVCFIYFAMRKNHLPRHQRWAGAHLAYLGILSAVGLGLYHLSFPWKEKLAVLIICSLLLIFIFRFISFKALKQLLINR